MKKIIGITCFCFLLLHTAQAQFTGIGTADPQATLDVNGTFRLGQGAMVNGITGDSLLYPGSDSLLPTQMAIKRYIQNGKWLPNEGETDSAYIVTSQSEALPNLKKIVYQDGMAYVLGNHGLWIFDVSDPDTIIQRDSIKILFDLFISDLEISGDFAYVSIYGNEKFHVYDVSNPDSIILRTTNTVPYGFRDVVIDGDYAYLVAFNYSSSNIIVYNISDPDTLITHLVYNLLFDAGPEMIEKTGKWLWVICPNITTINGHSDVWRFKADNPDTLILQNQLTYAGITKSIATAGNRFYATQFNYGNSYIMGFQTNQTSHTMLISPLIIIPSPINLHTNGEEMFAAVGVNEYPTVINYNISTIEPKPKWVYEGLVNSVTTINHLRFLGGYDKLYQFKLEPSQDKRDLIRNPDGTLGYQISPWYTDSIFNITTDNGYVGIGTDNPDAKLHVKGDQRIDGYHTIEFGADIPGKEINAGKIGYGTFSGDALDIVGAGPEGNRRIDLFGEDGVDITGKLIVQDSVICFGSVIGEEGFIFSQHVGIGAPPTPEQTLLVNDGMLMDAYGSTPAGVWINKPDNIAANANFIGDRGDQVAGIKTVSGWNLLESGISHHFGIGIEPGTDKLSVGGSCSAEVVGTKNDALFQNDFRIAGNHSFSFHADGNAFIGYETLTPQTLDVLCSGYSNHQIIHLLAEGGTIIDGPLHIQDTLIATSITTETWTDLGLSLQNGWVNYGNGFVTISMYKDLKGVVHLRGLITGGLNQQNTIIVSLPAGYRPVSGHQVYAVPNGVDTAGRIDVESDGDVVFRGVTNTFLSLDQISFKTN